MKCSQCQSCETKVIESRDVVAGEAIRRRRECVECGHRFTTYERIERPDLIVVKNDGTREFFNRDKLLSGLRQACQKTPVSAMQLETLVSKLERTLYDSGDAEIHSRHIGELAMNYLSDVNEVAYVRFASVYRRFKDIESFERELSQFREHKVQTDTSKAAK